MSKNLVSIIIPIYNGEQYIERCLHSIKKQSWKKIEVIIVDDGSTDNTMSLLEQFKLMDSRFHVYSQINKGPSAARNLALEKATGEYILFVDIDDYIDCEAIEKLMKHAIGYTKVMVFCDNFEIWPQKCDRRKLFQKTTESSVVSKRDVMWEIGSGRAGLVCGKLISSDLVKDNDIKFDETKSMSEDQIFFLELATKASNFFYLNQSLYYYDRRNESSLTLKYQPNVFEMQLLVQKKIQKVFSENGFSTEKDKTILLNRFKDILWYCINNEISSNNILKTVRTVKKINNIISNSEVNKIFESVIPNNIEEKLMFWALKRKNGTLTFLLQWIKSRILIPSKKVYLKLRIEGSREIG